MPELLKNCFYFMQLLVTLYTILNRESSDFVGEMKSKLTHSFYIIYNYQHFEF